MERAFPSAPSLHSGDSANPPYFKTCGGLEKATLSRILPDPLSALAPRPQTVNLWCCWPSGGGRGDAGGATIVYFGPAGLRGENGGDDGGGRGEEGGGAGSGEESIREEWDGDGCPQLVASVCTYLLCPAYVRRCWSGWLFVVLSVSASSLCDGVGRCTRAVFRLLGVLWGRCAIGSMPAVGCACS